MQAVEVAREGRRMLVDVGEDDGRAVPCVLLHPFPLDGRAFADCTRRLGARARAVVPHMRGFGGSDLGGPYSIADLADDVAAILDHLGVERAVVGGVSMGGYVALAFAQRYPRRLRGLILADTRAGADSDEARAGRAKAIALAREQGPEAFIEAQLPRLLGPDASEEVRTEVRRIGVQPAPALVAALEALRDRPDRRAELAQIACPTLVLVGTEDVLTPPAEAAAMATAIPRAVLVELPGAGHLANLEAPADFARAVAGFVGRAGISV